MYMGSFSGTGTAYICVLCMSIEVQYKYQWATIQYLANLLGLGPAVYQL